jgi:hypothetical protein
VVPAGSLRGTIATGPFGGVAGGVDARDDGMVRRVWLGDALDFWKGAMLRVLHESAPPVPGVLVVPMFTDSGWSAAEIETYARILDVPAASLLSTAQLTKATRTGYFNSCAGRQEDLFLDPDTGVSLGKAGTSHVTPDEIHALLTADNVVAVYQHRPQRAPAGWLGCYVAVVRGAGALTVSYQSAQVAMIFATKSPERETALRQALSRRLGAVAAARGTIPGRLA